MTRNWKKLENIKEKETKRIAKLENERRNFDKKSKRPFHVIDTTNLRLHKWRMPKDHTLSFMVILKKPIPRILVDLKLEQAFGDLE